MKETSRIKRRRVEGGCCVVGVKLYVSRCKEKTGEDEGFLMRIVFDE